MGHSNGSGNIQTRRIRVSAFILESLFRLPLIVRLDSSVPRGALRSYFDHPVTRIARCDWGSDKQILYPKESPRIGKDVLEHSDKKKHLINIWDRILVKVDKQVYLPP